MNAKQTTIAAIATPPGQGGVGVIRLSGPDAYSLGLKITGRQSLTPRYAHYATFFGASNEVPPNASAVIDYGLALYFPGPKSFTGEDVVELQGHGGPAVLDRLLATLLTHGAILAEPGEFSKRAFLNGKMDLTQAEAVADLIHATSTQAAAAAVASLSGQFADEINKLLEQTINLRKFVEAAIDFPEEEVDFISESNLNDDLTLLLQQLENIRQAAKQGAVLQEGMSVVLMGKPNAGKSSLLNRLSGRDSAIVTNIPGTTRDTLTENISLDGLPVRIIDTAGLRATDDVVELEGVRRAENAIAAADCLLAVVDSTEHRSVAEVFEALPELAKAKADAKKVIICFNKSDQSDMQVGRELVDGLPVVTTSAKTGDGIDALVASLQAVVGYVEGEGTFLARRRHLDALTKTLEHVEAGRELLKAGGRGEILAEELLLAQRALGAITGEFSADDLLGEIFSSFCIGK